MSFKALSKSLQAQPSTAQLSIADKIKNLTFLKTKLLPTNGLAPSLTVCLLVDGRFKNANIWFKFVEEAQQRNADVNLFVVTMDASCTQSIPAAFRIAIDPSVAAEFQSLSGATSSNSGGSSDNVGYRRLRASLTMLEEALKACPNSSHFALLTGDAIPVMSGQDCLANLKAHESLMSFPDRIAFTHEKTVKVNWLAPGVNGVNTLEFGGDSKFVRIERFGLILCNHHVNLLSRINSEIGIKFYNYWSSMTCFYKDDAICTYFPTALDVLGYYSVPNKALASNICARKVCYHYFVGHENEKDVFDAMFDAEYLSLDMIREFRSNGSFFAVDFDDNLSFTATTAAAAAEINDKCVQNWNDLVVLKTPNTSSISFPRKEIALDGSNDFYSSNRNIIRYNGFPVDFDSELSVYLNARAVLTSRSASNNNHEGVDDSNDGLEAANSMNFGKRSRDFLVPSNISDVSDATNNKVRIVEDDHSSKIYRCFNDSLWQSSKSDAANSQSSKAKGFRNVKIVINSHIRYKKSLSVLLQSILDSDVGVEQICDQSFNGPCFSWEVIVSIAGCDEDVPPKREIITTIADITFGSGSAVVPFVTVVRSKLNSFDWTGKAALFKYKDDPIISSDYYVYILDTSKVDKSFKAISSHIVPVINISEIQYEDDRKSKWVVKSPDKFREKIFITPHPHSSISIFGKGVVRNWGLNFDRAISKNDGLTMEVFEKPIYHADGFVQHGITRFGDVSRLQNRKRLPDICDWYTDPTGSSSAASGGSGSSGSSGGSGSSTATSAVPLRTIYHYPQLGIYKAILVGLNQDGNSVTQLKVAANIVGKR